MLAIDPFVILHCLNIDLSTKPIKNSSESLLKKEFKRLDKTLSNYLTTDFIDRVLYQIRSLRS